MVAAQLFLNLAPLVGCVFVTFFGRMFSDLLRLILNFCIVVGPLMAGSLQEQLDGTTVGLTPVALLGSMWSLLAGVGVAYMGIKRPAFGRKLETVGISFLCVLVLNSYYLGYAHGTVRHTAPATVTYLEWLVPLATGLLALLLHFVRNLPGLKNWMDSFYMALAGGFFGLQVLCAMEWSITDGLSYKRLLSHDFGCSTTSCYVTMSVTVGLIILGTVMQFLFFRAGTKGAEDETWDDGLENVMGKLKSMLGSLINVNKAIRLYSTEYSASEAAAAMLTVTEDIYKFIGSCADVLLLTFSVGLIVNCVEFFHHDLIGQLQAQTLLTVCMVGVCVLAVALTVAAWFLRFGKKTVASSEWKKQNMMFLLLTGICWPLLVFASCFVLTIGGEELAYMDVPLINHKFGFHKIPIGCASHLPSDDTENDGIGSFMQNSHRDTANSIGNDGDTGSWDGDHCHDGLFNMGEYGVDCGGKKADGTKLCFTDCLACQCSFTGIITNGSTVTPGCELQEAPNASSVDLVHSMLAYSCFMMDGAGCAASGAYGELVNGDWRYCNPLPTRDGLLFDDDFTVEVAHPGAGVESAAPVAAETVEVTEVWYCENAICYECSTAACLGQCTFVQRLALELPIMVWLMWGVTIVSLISALTASGELGGLYLLVERLCSYLTILNLIQGFLMALAAFMMGGDVDGMVDGDVSVWNVAFIAGVFLFLESAVGLVGTSCAGGALGGVLWGYLVALILTLLTFAGVFFAAAYYATNADEYVDAHWDEYIYPELVKTNATQIPEFRGVSHLSKDEFVEYARGSFRLLLIAGIWTMTYMTALVVATKMTITRRHGEGAEFARTRLKNKDKGATSNPMYSDMEVMGGDDESPKSGRESELSESLTGDD